MVLATGIISVLLLSIAWASAEVYIARQINYMHTVCMEIDLRMHLVGLRGIGTSDINPFE